MMTADVVNVMAQIAGDLQDKQIPIHSLIAAQGGRVVFEKYWFPFDRERTHRMFSITKSFTSIAIGFLMVEGKLHLSDPIIKYFPEYDRKDLHPLIRRMTIEDMLTMQTCHSRTTYKIHPDKNWVESFFTVDPTNPSGKLFQYDTSSAHTLAALVRKLSGRSILSYLHDVCPEAFTFSEDTHVLADPFGSEIGGSGLALRPMDLMKVGLWIRNELKYYISKSNKSLFLRKSGDPNTDGDPISDIGDYLFRAVSFHVATAHFGQTLEEQMGYGYQFWRIRGGFAMYGMGGQYLLFYPDQDLILSTTADTQNLKGGTQILLGSIYDHLKTLPGFKDSVEKSLALLGACPQSDVFTGKFILKNENPAFKEIWLNIAESEGCLELETRQERCMKIPFSLSRDCECPIEDPEDGNTLSAVIHARLVRPGELFIRAELTSDEMGWLIFDLRYDEASITLYSRTVVEGKFVNWNGIYFV